MRMMVLVLAVTALSGCERERASAPVDAPVVPAAFSYEGANAKTPEEIRTHGERLAYVLGCAGCHGEDYAGTNVTEGEPGWGKMYAANLTLLMDQYSDEELDRAIRLGVPKDGHEMIFMPSEAFEPLSDADVAAIIAHLRTLKPKGEKMPPHEPGPIYQEMVKHGYKGTADAVQQWKGKGPIDLGEQLALGRYIARTTCSECHDLELKGTPGFTPDLDIAGMYSNAELDRLLITGVGKTNRTSA